MSDTELNLPPGFSVANNNGEIRKKVLRIIAEVPHGNVYPPHSQEYPANSQFPCVVKVYADNEPRVRIEYFPLSLYKEVMEFKAASNSLAGIKNAAPRATELGVHVSHRSLPETNKDEIVGYCILMQAIYSASNIQTKQFYGRGSIISIRNRAFDCVGIFEHKESVADWHMVSAFPLTETDLEEFATLTHIPDA